MKQDDTWAFKPKKVGDTIKNAILLFLTCLFLTSCGRYSDGTSVWAGLAWLLLVVTFVPAAWFFSVAYRKSKSGSESNNREEGYQASEKNVKITSIGQFWYGVALTAVGIIIIIVQNASK